MSKRSKWSNYQRAVMRDLGRAMGAPESATREALAAVLSDPPPMTMHFTMAPEQPLRHTQLGMRPINVNTIDEMDLALSNQMAELNRLRRALATLQQEVNAAKTMYALALEYAEAHTEWKEIGDRVGNLGLPHVKQRWRQARDAYRRSLE